MTIWGFWNASNSGQIEKRAKLWRTNIGGWIFHFFPLPSLTQGQFQCESVNWESKILEKPSLSGQRTYNKKSLANQRVGRDFMFCFVFSILRLVPVLRMIPIL
jgi:hypothetical protein